MDWADDIAYAVHDAEDFYRAGLVPLDRLGDITEIPATTKTSASIKAIELERFIDMVYEQWRREGKGKDKAYERDEAFRRLRQMFTLVQVDEPYKGTRVQRAALRTWTSRSIGEYVRAVHLSTADPEQPVVIDANERMEVDVLKELTRHYVILNPGLAAQQHGQRRVVRKLFDVFHTAARSLLSDERDWIRHVLPRAFADALADLEESAD
jgi:dGTPase